MWELGGLGLFLTCFDVVFRGLPSYVPRTLRILNRRQFPALDFQALSLENRKPLNP